MIGRTFIADDDYSRVDEQLDAAVRWRAVYAGLGKLPEADRRLLELVAIDGLSSAEAASALGINGVAARVRLSRARVRLRDLLAAASSTLPIQTHLTRSER